MKKVFLIPNLVTAFALACGLYVIFRMALADEVTFPLVQTTVLLLLVAAVADVLDGAIARFIKAESEFGVQFDSLSDAVTFGVAPAVIVLKTIAPVHGEPYFFTTIASCLIFSVCGILRLVRFNVATHKAETDEAAKKAQKKHFTGMPIPAGALAFVSFNFFLASPDFAAWFGFQPATKSLIVSIMALILGYFMISRWKFPSIKTLHFRVRSTHLVLTAVIIALILIYGLTYHFPLLLLLVVWSYVLLAWSLSLARLIAGRRSKTLEEFEPEPEDD